MPRAVLLAALLGLVAAAPAAATGPELGARLSPVPLVYELQPWAQLTNQSTVPVRVSLEFVGDDGDPGWSLAVESFSLARDEMRRVPVTAAGPDDAVLRATIRPVLPQAGADVTTLVLETLARHQSPLEALGASWWPLVLLLAVLMALLGLRLALRRRP